MKGNKRLQSLDANVIAHDVALALGRILFANE